ncbi:MAG: DUF853 family protein, partial [Planctomycetes bacterium]|nr:DUF853 family protein [Planctomycetota bacterium]
MKKIVRSGIPAYVLKGYCLILSTLLIYLADDLFLSEELIYVCVAGLLILASYAAWSGHGVTSLWRDIRDLKAISIKRDEIPKKEGMTFLGYGSELDLQDVERQYAFKKLPRELIEMKNEALGGSSLLHGLIKHKEKPLFIPNGSLNEHALVLGTTGVGKTRALELLILQALERREPLFIIDPKGDEDLMNLTYNVMREQGREDLLKYLSLAAPSRSCKYNPLGTYQNPQDIADRINPLMGGDKKSAGNPFQKFCWSVVNDIAHLMHQLGRSITFKDIERYAFHDPWALVADGLVELVGIPKERLEELGKLSIARVRAEATRYQNDVRSGSQKNIEPLTKFLAVATHDKDNYQKMTNSLVPVMSMLCSGEIGRVLNPEPDDRDVFSWNWLIKKGGVVYMH